MRTSILSVSKFLSLIIGTIAIVPIIIIFTSFLDIDTNIWIHLKNYVLPELIVNTVLLIFGVSLGTLCIGVPLAYLNSFFDYPARKFFTFLAILPLAIPAYIMAFVYIALFDSTGTWSIFIKNFLNLSFFLPSIRNFWGVSFVLSLCFYPYVYLLAKNAFENQGIRAIEVGQTMGLSSFSILRKITIPLARPWIFSGLLLALMETLGDFGAVSIFNYSTFTTAIYRSWFGLYSLKSAEQLASLLIIAVLFFVILERQLDKKKSYTTIGRGGAKPQRVKLNFFGSFLALSFSFLVSFFSFLIPATMITKWAIEVFNKDFDERYLGFILNSIQISTFTVAVLLIAGLIMAYAVRKYPGIIGVIIKNLSSLGYAVPGSVLAVGVFIFLNTIETQIGTGQKILTGGLVGLIAGLSIRFYSLCLAPLSTSFLRITDSHFSVMSLSKNKKYKNFFNIILPLIKPGIISAALIIFVEVLKEMPITLMTRPFGKETLAIRIFEMTSEGEWQRAALPSLFLILVSLIPTILIHLQSENNHDK